MLISLSGIIINEGYFISFIDGSALNESVHIRPLPEHTGERDYEAVKQCDLIIRVLRILFFEVFQNFFQ